MFGPPKPNKTSHEEEISTSKDILEHLQSSKQITESNIEPNSFASNQEFPVSKRKHLSPNRNRKRVKVDDLDICLNQLPSSHLFEWSYMHRAPITFTLCTKQNYIITSSLDGHVKFWHKTVENIEFVKDFIVSDKPVTHLHSSHDGKWLIAVSGSIIAVFDVLNFDLINCILLDYHTEIACIFFSSSEKQWLCATANENEINIYKLSDTKEVAEPIRCLKIHSSKVCFIEFNFVYNCIISTDQMGMIEYWDVNTYQFPETLTRVNGEQCSKNLFKFKSNTDLYVLAKIGTHVRSLSFDERGTKFATVAKDRFIRIFDFFSGKLLHIFNETLEFANRIQQEKSPTYFQFHLEDFDFGKRLSVEKALENDPFAPRVNAIFDKSGRILIYPSLWGIKYVDLETEKVVRLLGKSENTERFLSISLFQGIVDIARVHLANIEKKRALNPNDPLLPRRATNKTGEALLESMNNDPMIFAAAYSRERFYIFSRREPLDVSSENPTLSRDIFNERPKQEELSNSVRVKKKGDREIFGIIHTTKGDIHFKLFPQFAPKAVENFVQHSQEGYYNNCIFHRVIKDFMIQTGDPTATGMGGESIWGAEFEDEFHNEVTFDRPYRIAMANAGRNSNGSQFFITTQPTTWLNNKHTIFGEVVEGIEVAHAIENVKIYGSGDMQNRPVEDVKIVSITIN